MAAGPWLLAGFSWAFAMGPRIPPGALVDATFSLGLALGMREWVVDGRYIPSLSMLPTFDQGARRPPLGRADAAVRRRLTRAPAARVL